MVLRQRESKMASEQPVKKKLRRTDDNEDEPDYIHNIAENGVRTDLSALHLSLPANVNEADVNVQLHNGGDYVCRTNQTNTDNRMSDLCTVQNYTNGISHTIPTTSAPQPFINTHLPYSFPAASTTPNSIKFPNPQIYQVTNHDRQEEKICQEPEDDFATLQNHLIKQCLCELSENILRKSFEKNNVNGTRILLSEWPTNRTLTFLSILQLMFDIYLKQNNKGLICSRIADICDALVRNEYNLVEQIATLCETRNRYIIYLSAKVLSSFFIIAKRNVDKQWLDTITNYLTTEYVDYNKINFALEIIKRVVEWKDVETHVLEESIPQDSASTSTSSPEIITSCTTIPYSDPESYDTSAIKGLIIKSLESKWPDLIVRIKYFITNNSGMQSQTCVLTFLALWESTISIKANLSVIDTKPFHTHLEIFVSLLNSSLPPIIWKQLLSLFNEVLCYGSTLALQDMLPDDTCQLAHLVVRYVKDYRLLDSLPFHCRDGFTVHGFVGTIISNQGVQATVDKTLLQKMVLLVLKSVAVTIKETRSDSSDSSVGSDDSDFYQDMQLIERSIRDVLKKVDVFVKSSLDFHPETHFSKSLIQLFSDQDDYLVESMVCTLDITIGISYRNAIFPDLVSMLNPIFSFIEFLKVVSHDSDVLLDYLVSNETCFLLYLLRFLKYIRRNWPRFITSCENAGANELDNTMTVLIRLKMQINRLVSKNLFPYNISPVLRLLEMCEGLYESNEYS